MAAALGALLALLGAPLQVWPLQVSVPEPRTVALLFQPVLLRCHFQVSSPGPAPIVTWKYKSFCPDTWAGPGATWDSPGEAAGACPDSARTVRIVATKQGTQVTLGDFYLGRPVTIQGGAELSLGPAAWGDSGLYLCTVTSTSDLQGNNEAVAELVVLGSLPEGSRLLPEGTLPVYLAGKAATSGGTFSPSPHPALPLQLLGSSQSSQVPLLRDGDSAAPSGPPPSVLRYLEEQLHTWGGGGAREWPPERRLEPREPRGVSGTPKSPKIPPKFPQNPKTLKKPQISPKIPELSPSPARFWAFLVP
ncbi:lipolysis-stimulated lipoprotein receptor isoform X5 [Taeniopygia guttata]|uniref:lipolysis-stimulated lipoprotein receptor isoform X5 n=1 Tax=Taeniopygia guttata TaxID=59729 RepID=UPI003BB87749